jgi:uncharacterized protein (DUF4415 family)
MTANARNTRRAVSELPTLDDVAAGRVSLDDYEVAHGEDIPEWTDEQFKRARPMAEMFPDLVEGLVRSRGQRGPQKSETKHRIGLRLDRAVVEYFRATGPGWQTRINDVLAEHVRKNS